MSGSRILGTSLRPGDRIAIDVAPVRADPAGVGLYVALLTRELVRAAADVFALIGVREEAHAYTPEDATLRRRPFRTLSYHTWMQFVADRDARALGARLVHFTNAAAPVASRLPYVLTVHDLSVMRMPRVHPVARWGIVPVNLAAIARAVTIIVPSRFTARELRRIGVDARRTVVIPHAAALPAADDDVNLLRRLGLDEGRYVLYFGTLEPRKNIVRLVAAFERAAAAQPDLRLVLAGSPGWRSGPIAARVAASPLRDRIVQPGYLDDDDLARLIAHCGVVAYVSLYEGFGMPVLDAMALGAPVVTSRTTAMPEAADGAAVLVDPRDEADVARGIAAALHERDDLATRGRARASERTWADVAAEHLDVYRHALARAAT